MVSIDEIIDRIIDRRAKTPGDRSLLVGVSGIDGCGKGYIASQLEAHLAQRGIPSVVINVDDWLNLPEKRFDREAPAENFYQHAIRFDELFANLVMPLREHRSIHLVADCLEETARQYRKRTYDIKDVDVILVEGILLFKNQYRNFFDVRIWVECSFVTALARAIERGQEGLSMAKTIAAYENIYFPAQRIHIDRDDPKAAADLTYNNDLYRPQRSLVAGVATGTFILIWFTDLTRRCACLLFQHCKTFVNVFVRGYRHTALTRHAHHRAIL